MLDLCALPDVEFNNFGDQHLYDSVRAAIGHNTLCLSRELWGYCPNFRPHLDDLDVESIVAAHEDTIYDLWNDYTLPSDLPTLDMFRHVLVEWALEQACNELDRRDA